MGVIRHKIWYDLWENKGRTWRVVAIIAIGAFAIGAILGGFLFGLLQLQAVGLLGSLITATVGAMVLIALLRRLEKQK